MGCGSSASSRRNGEGEPEASEDSDAIGIITEMTPKQKNELATQPQEVRRIPPSQQMAGLQLKEDMMNKFLFPYKPSQYSLLVVDDASNATKTVIGWFEETKYKVKLHTDGEEAIKWADSLPEDPKTKLVKQGELSLVLMDMNSTTENGPLLDAFMNNPRYAKIPLVVMGSEYSSQQAERYIMRGASDALHKPLSRALVLKTVKTILQQPLHIENCKNLKKLGDAYKTELNNQKRRSVNLKNNGAEVSVSRQYKGSNDIAAQDDDVIPDLPQAHVLVIDDDSEVTDKMTSWLSKNYTVTCHSDCMEGYEFLESLQPLFMSHAPGPVDETGTEETPPVDLVIAEAATEGELSGMQLLDRMQTTQDTKDIPVMLMSSEDTSTADMTKSIRMGCESYMTKPLSKNVTLKKVDTILLAIAQQKKTMQYVERAMKYQNMLVKEKGPDMKIPGSVVALMAVPEDQAE